MHRRLINKTFLLFLFLFPGITNANIINVFFAGGQSNAKSEWVNGIKDGLIASNKYENIVIVHQIHSGDWLHSWYSGNTSQENFNVDFYNDQGTGALENIMSDTNALFSGLFWFQGEGDTGSNQAMDVYADRFNGMIGDILLRTSSIDTNFHSALSIIDADYDQYQLPGGRTSDDINKMRQIQIALAGDYYFDTRGLERTDAFHLTQEALYTAGYGLGVSFTTAVPVPAGIWLFGSGLIGLIGMRKMIRLRPYI